MIVDNQRPRGQNPAIIILHAKVRTDHRLSFDLDDAILSDHRLVLKLPSISANLLH
jgi:hypothetical protein